MISIFLGNAFNFPFSWKDQREKNLLLWKMMIKVGISCGSYSLSWHVNYSFRPKKKKKTLIKVTLDQINQSRPCLCFMKTSIDATRKGQSKLKLVFVLCYVMIQYKNAFTSNIYGSFPIKLKIKSNFLSVSGCGFSDWATIKDLDSV